MVGVPLVLMVVFPFGIGLALRSAQSFSLHAVLANLPHQVAAQLNRYTSKQQLTILVNQYLFIPLFLMVPLMVASVLAADAFAGERDRPCRLG